MQLEFTEYKFRLFKEKYDKAVESNLDKFEFEGNEVLTVYAKYVVEHLTNQFSKMHKEVEKAKNILKNAGYYVDNLWHVDDVFYKYNCTSNEVAQDVLNRALLNEATMEQIWFAIDHHALEEGLERNND